jgi:hypothetical protein
MNIFYQTGSIGLTAKLGLPSAKHRASDLNPPNTTGDETHQESHPQQYSTNSRTASS